MTSAATPISDATIGGHSRARSRTVAAAGTTWSATMGVLPHVLHHVGPLAGAAVVAGTTGTVVFGLAAFVFMVPALLRVRRRCGSWHVPATLLAVFAGVWVLSTFVAGPWVRDQLVDTPVATQQAPTSDERSAGVDQDDAEHDSHHPADEES